jgi:hypothetical protein
MRRFDVPCLIEIEQTADTLHAHAIPEGVDLRAGDSVWVHGAPAHIEYGERFSIETSATIIRATALGRTWTYLRSFFELSELFEVGFQPKESA